MTAVQVSNLTGVNLYMNPLNQNNGEFLQCINMDSDPYGAKRKRGGFNAVLNNPGSAEITRLFQWRKNDGTTFFNYQSSGSSLYYSIQGTGDWTLAGNGTIGNGAFVDYAVLDDTLIICDGVGSTRHTTNGTSFTNTTLAPVAVSLAEYQNRIYAAGTASTTFASSANSATNWNTSGTSDSFSFTVPGSGKMNRLFKVSDRLLLTKNTRNMYLWDGYQLIDPAWSNGPGSKRNLAVSDGFWFWANDAGVYGFGGGGRPQLLSNAVQPQFYNSSGSAMSQTYVNNSAPGVVHRYDYLMYVKNYTDNVTKERIFNGLLKYEYQKNEFSNYTFYPVTTAMMSYVDNDGNRKLMLGSDSGDCHELDPGSKSDDGGPIACQMLIKWNSGVEYLDKKFNWLSLFFNPGNEARVQVAICDHYDFQRMRWIDIGDCSGGYTSYRFPTGSRGKFLFIKITETSVTSDFVFYGYTIDAEVIPGSYAKVPRP